MMDVLRTLGWYVVLFFAFFGWGAILARWTRVETLDSGLRTIWGMALGILVTLVLTTLHVPLFYPLMVWLGVGLAGACGSFGLAGACGALGLAGAGREHSRWRPRFSFSVLEWIAIVFILFILVFQGTIEAHRHFNIYDDELAYIPMAVKMLTTGDMMEPFSLRRMASYGGQAVLHVFHLLAAPVETLALMDGLFCLTILALCLWQLRVGSGWTRRIWLVFVVVFLFDDFPRINIASQVSGVILFMAFWRTQELLEERTERSGRLATVVAMVALALASLRSHFVLAAFLMLFFGLLGSIRRPAARFNAGFAAFLFVLFCLPSALQMYLSNGTPWYPVWPGNFNAQFGTFPTMTLAEIASTGWANLLALNFFSYLTLGALFAVVHRRVDGPVRACVVALAIGLSLSVLTKNIVSADVIRYDSGLLFVACVGLVSLALRDFDRMTPDFVSRVRGIASLAVIGIFTLAEVSASRLSLTEIRRKFESREMRLDAEQTLKMTPAEEANASHEVQELIPPGARILAAIDKPHLLDFRRNPVFLLDIPGNASPWRDKFSFRNHDEVISDLKAMGIKYLLFVEPKETSGLYSYKFWLQKNHGNLDYHAMWVIRFGEYFDFLDSLKSDPARAQRSGPFWVVRI